MIDYLLGIDPSTTSTGVVMLRVERRVTKGRHGAIQSADPFYRRTIKPTQRKREGYELRLRPFAVELYDTLKEAISALPTRDTPFEIVIENPEMLGPHAKSNSAVMSAFGVAVGVVSLAYPGVMLHLLRAQTWIPKRMDGNRRRHLTHDRARALLHQMYPKLAPLTDDETFAAGCAIAWLTGGPLRI